MIENNNILLFEMVKIKNDSDIEKKKLDNNYIFFRINSHGEAEFYKVSLDIPDRENSVVKISKPMLRKGIFEGDIFNTLYCGQYVLRFLKNDDRFYYYIVIDFLGE